MATSRLSLKNVVSQFADYYKKPENRAWGSLHIVLDDGNTDIGCVQFCLDWAKDHGDEDGVRLAILLEELTETQRSKIRSRVNEYLRKKRASKSPGS